MENKDYSNNLIEQELNSDIINHICNDHIDEEEISSKTMVILIDSSDESDIKKNKNHNKKISSDFLNYIENQTLNLFMGKNDMNLSLNEEENKDKKIKGKF